MALMAWGHGADGLATAMVSPGGDYRQREADEEKQKHHVQHEKRSDRF